MEGLHPILRPAWTPHCANIHFPRTDEQSILQTRFRSDTNESFHIDIPTDNPILSVVQMLSSGHRTHLAWIELTEQYGAEEMIIIMMNQLTANTNINCR